MSTKVGLTIDWDYFVPEDLTWDLGHRENLMFLNFAWRTRGYLYDKMVTTGEELHFWDWFRSWAPPVPTITVSDSHLFALNDNLLIDSDIMILVDQHHDLFGDDPLTKLDCGNWARYWLNEVDDRELIWVKPTHSIYELPENLTNSQRARTTVVTQSEFDAKKLLPANYEYELVSVHACRSGCWTAPWLDSQFIDFIERSNMDLFPLQTDDWDPLRARWNENDISSMLDMHRRTQEVWAKLQET